MSHDCHLFAQPVGSSNQTYWIEFPAACLYYNIPGQWALVRANIIAYVPQGRLDDPSNSSYQASYVGQQQVSYATAQAWVAQEDASVGTSWDTWVQDQSVSDSLDYGLPVTTSGDPLSSDGN